MQYLRRLWTRKSLEIKLNTSVSPLTLVAVKYITKSHFASLMSKGQFRTCCNSSIRQQCVLSTDAWCFWFQQTYEAISTEQMYGTRRDKDNIKIRFKKRCTSFFVPWQLYGWNFQVVGEVWCASVARCSSSKYANFGMLQEECGRRANKALNIKQYERLVMYLYFPVT